MTPKPPNITQYQSRLALMNVATDVLSVKPLITCHPDDINPNSTGQLGFKLGFKLGSEPHVPKITQYQSLALINVTTDVLSDKPLIVCHIYDLNPNSTKQLGFNLGFKLGSEPYDPKTTQYHWSLLYEVCDDTIIMS